MKAEVTQYVESYLHQARLTLHQAMVEKDANARADLISALHRQIDWAKEAAKNLTP